MPAKRAVAEAVQEVGGLFAPHGWQVTSWRHETAGTPELGADVQDVLNRQVPSDYDIYVGLMCRRFGTPTPRAPSGTVEEFLEAQERFMRTGKPDILFYFCTDSEEPETEAERLQFEKVVDFRKAYPGLFATFHAVDDLKASVKHHLVDLLLREPRRMSPRKRGWSLWLGQRLDSLPKPPVYLERSSGFVVRSLGKLGTLLDLPNLMSDEEYETLLAAEYLRALRFSNDDLREVQCKIRDLFRSAFDWDAALLVADLSDTETIASGEAHQLNGVRCGFLAALLRLGDLLDLDHATITTASGSLSPPPADRPIENWLAYLTRSVRVSRGGVIAFHLIVSTEQKALAARLRRSVALMFEAHWHQLRGVLSVHGVAVARMPMELAPSPDLAAIPDGVLAEIDLATEQAEKAIPDLQHLAETPPSPVALEKLLPLPSSAIVHPVRFTFHPDLRHKLRLWREDGADVRELAANGPGEILLDPELLSPPGARYRWSLQRDDDDFFSEVGAGAVWQLAPADQMRLAAGKSSPYPPHTLLSGLGLHNDLLQDLWPKLLSGEGSLGEFEGIYDALLAGYEWLQTNAPRSGQLDLIRNAGSWVHNRIVKEKGE